MASNSGFLHRLSQLRVAFANTRAVDATLVPLVVGVPLAVLVVCVVVGAITDRLVAGLVFGVVLGLLAGLVVFGRRTSAAALGMIEGKPGAAAAVLQSLRGWRVTPAVAYTRKQDFVHRAVGRAGVVMVGEGAPARVTALLRQERRRMARIVGDTPVHEISVGDGAGQVPLRQLQTSLAKLPRRLKPDAAKALDTRLQALGDSDLPLPKGPIPRAPRRR